MTRSRAALAALACAGCWSGSSPPPQEPPAREAPQPRDAKVPEIATPAITNSVACPSGQGLTAAISKVSSQDPRTIVVIDAGQNAGITPRWSIGGPGGCAIVRIEPTRTIAACAGTTPARIRAAPTAVLCAPLPLPANPLCPSGISVDARIVGFTLQGTGAEITVGAGTIRGVASSWTIVRPACAVQRVSERTTVATCPNLTPDQVKASPTALLCAP